MNIQIGQIWQTEPYLTNGSYWNRKYANQKFLIIDVVQRLDTTFRWMAQFPFVTGVAMFQYFDYEDLTNHCTLLEEPV
jgi:hypothetical protein